MWKIAAAAAVVALTVSACSSSIDSVVSRGHVVTEPAAVSTSVDRIPSVAMFACSDEQGLLLLQWTGVEPTFQGTATEVGVSGGPPYTASGPQPIPLDGTVSGDSVRLSFAGGPDSFGRFDDGDLLLQTVSPDGSIVEHRCDATDPAGWNQTVADLHAHIAAENSTYREQLARQAEADHEAREREKTARRIESLQSALSNAEQRLRDQIGMLDDDALESSMGDVRSALEEVRSRAEHVNPQEACDFGDASYAAGSVDVAASAVELAAGRAESRIHWVESQMDDLQDQIRDAQGLRAQLLQYGVSPSVDIDSTLTAAMGAVAKAETVIGGAQSEIDRLVDEAYSVTDDAYARAEDMCG